MPDPTQTLCLSGMILFAAGLINGFAIPAMRSPRLGLSAHLTGLQSGTFLIATGLLWPHLALSAGWSAMLAHGLWISLFAVWGSLVLAGVFGAGQNLPIAGGGITTTPARQAVVSVLLISGSLGVMVAVAAVVATWQWQA